MVYWEQMRSIPKTLFFNFKYFPFRVAVKCPVFISHRVLLKRLSGTVELGRVRTGIVKIGFGDVPLFDSRKVRSVLIIEGRLVFQGDAVIGPGCHLEVFGELVCGDGFAITAYSLISAKKGITFGKNVMIAWDVSVIDHDWHNIYDEFGTTLNPAKQILIGDDVWICFRALILKGCKIQDGVIVAAGTTVTGSPDASNAIIAEDAKLRIIKKKVFWKK